MRLVAHTCARAAAAVQTLTLALFRVVEIASGAIRIDGRDIAGMGLRVLRHGLTIIPQGEAGILAVASHSWCCRFVMLSVDLGS